jgi:preprotein translocase subunit YajC
MLDTLVILAQESEKKGPGGGGGVPFELMLLLLGMMLLYFIIVVIPGKRKQEKERQAMITNMKKNDEVLTIAGIYGTFVSSSETKDEVIIKVDDGTRLKVTRASILRNITAEEAAKKPAEQKPATEQK